MEACALVAIALPDPKTATGQSVLDPARCALASHLDLKLLQDILWVARGHGQHRRRVIASSVAPRGSLDAAPIQEKKEKEKKALGGLIFQDFENPRNSQKLSETLRNSQIISSILTCGRPRLRHDAAARAARARLRAAAGDFKDRDAAAAYGLLLLLARLARAARSLAQLARSRPLAPLTPLAPRACCTLHAARCTPPGGVLVADSPAPPDI